MPYRDKTFAFLHVYIAQKTGILFPLEHRLYRASRCTNSNFFVSYATLEESRRRPLSQVLGFCFWPLLGNKRRDLVTDWKRVHHIPRCRPLNNSENMSLDSLATVNWLVFGFSIAAVLALVYLFHINRLMKGVPSTVQKLSGPRWTMEQLRRTYDELSKQPIDYTNKIPPRLDRRYIVIGGNGKTAHTMNYSVSMTIKL